MIAGCIQTSHKHEMDMQKLHSCLLGFNFLQKFLERKAYFVVLVLHIINFQTMDILNIQVIVVTILRKKKF